MGCAHRSCAAVFVSASGIHVADLTSIARNIQAGAVTLYRPTGGTGGGLGGKGSGGGVGLGGVGAGGDGLSGIGGLY
jgi:hypothetical protein